MKEKIAYYESIRKEYPEVIPKDQFYRIAKISKATALYLLSSGKVPCKDSGKKTRRYKIRTDDVIHYLIDRELHPEKYRACDLWYQERSGHHHYHMSYRNELTGLTEDEWASFPVYIARELFDYGDLLSVMDVVQIIGYCDTTIHRWCLDKRVRAFSISGKILIPMLSLIDFIASPFCCNITRKTWKHLLLIRSFLDKLDATESEKG